MKPTADEDSPDLVPSVGKTVTAAQIAREFGISKGTIYGLQDAGKLPYYRFGRTRRVALRDSERYLQSVRVGKSEP